MKTTETGVARLRELSEELTVHEAAVDRLTGGRRVYNKGYGGELVLQDGRSYGAFVSCGSSTPRMEINFFGEALRDPNKMARLGYLVLMLEDTEVRVGSVVNIGRSPHQEPSEYLHAYPAVPELARPLGDWLGDMAQRQLDKKERGAAADQVFHEENQRLTRFLREDMHELDEQAALEQAEDQLKRTFAASKRCKAAWQPVLGQPSLEDVATLEDHLRDPSGVSFTYKLSDDLNEALYMPTYLPGALGAPRLS